MPVVLFVMRAPAVQNPGGDPLPRAMLILLAPILQW